MTFDEALDMANEDLERSIEDFLPVNITRPALLALVRHIERTRTLAALGQLHLDNMAYDAFPSFTIDRTTRNVTMTKEMPLYTSHKQVRAAEIVEIKVHSQDTVELILSDGAEPLVMRLDNPMFARYMPVVGDFYVLYKDSYASFSPRKAFLEGYIPVGQSFADIKQGLRIKARTEAGTNIGDGVALTSIAHPGWPNNEEAEDGKADDNQTS